PDDDTPDSIYDPTAQPTGGPPAARKDRRRHGTAARIAVVFVALGLLAASVVLVVTRKPRAVHLAPVPPRPTQPPAAAFAFTSVRIHPLPAQRGVSTKTSTSVAEDVRGSLSSFYDAALTRPSTWTRGVPSDAWDAFDPTVRDRATSDEKSLALGDQAPDLRSLTVGSATLDITVLIDAAGHAQATVARVSIEASGALNDGSTVQVTVDASFVLRRIDQRWLITGWPQASLHIEPALAPSVGPSTGVSPSAPAGGAASPSAGPTPQASP